MSRFLVLTFFSFIIASQALGQVSDSFRFPVGSGFYLEAEMRPNMANPAGYYNAQAFANGVGHDGVDLNGNGGLDTDCEDPIFAVSSGTVVSSFYNGRRGVKEGFGEYIRIEHQTSNGLVYSEYGHFFPGTRRVFVNDRVERGELIGLMGNTGSSDYCHLHLSMMTDNFLSRGYYGRDNVPNTMFDPIPFIQARLPTHTLPPPSPQTLFNCAQEPVGDEDTGWVYTCPVNQNAFITRNDGFSRSIYGVFRIDDVEVNHTFRAALFVQNGAGEYVRDAPRAFIEHRNDQVEADGGWNFSYFWPSVNNIPQGNYQWRFYVDVGGGFPPLDQPEATLEFTVLDGIRIAGHVGDDDPQDNGGNGGPPPRPNQLFQANHQPEICGTEPQGGAHTNWVYTCRDHRLTFHPHERIFGLLRIDDVYANHRFKVRTYRNGEFRWQHVSDWTQGVDPNWGWSKSYFWTQIDNASVGDWEYRFYVDVGEGFQAEGNPVAQRRFSVITTPYTFENQNGNNPHTCNSEPQGGAHTNWVYSCNLQAVFAPHDLIWGLIRINDVFRDHRFKVRTYRNGAYDWQYIGQWNRGVDPEWGWEKAYFWTHINNASRGDWQWRFYIDTGDGFPANEDSFLSSVDFQVVAPPFELRLDQQNPKACIDQPVRGNCVNQQDRFDHRQSFHSSISLHEVYERHRVRMSTYKDGRHQYDLDGAWMPANEQWGERVVHWNFRVNNPDAGLWEFRFYVDVGDGFQPADAPLAVKQVRVDPAPQAPQPPQDCHGGLANYDWNYCSAACPCSAGEGDCDRNSDCNPGLTCVMNIGQPLGQHRSLDLCMAPDMEHCHRNMQNGAWAYCSAACPCQEGEGDCDRDSECRDDLVCGRDNGQQFGFPANADVCVPPEPANCHGNQQNGAWAYCSAACPCQDGEGDCDGDNECAPGLQCELNVGERFGFLPSADICTSVQQVQNPPPPPPPPPVQQNCHGNKRIGEYLYCTRDCPCNEGEGNCIKDRACAAGLTCMPRTGHLYGLAGTVSTCIPMQLAERLMRERNCHAGMNGDQNYCSFECKCQRGQGNCQTERDCLLGMYCTNRGAEHFGLPAGTNICN